MRQNGKEARIALWFLVAAFAALMIGRAHAEEVRPAPAAPAVAAPAAAPVAARPPRRCDPRRRPRTLRRPPPCAPHRRRPGRAAPPVVASMSQPSASTSEGLRVDAAAKAFRGQVILSDVMIAPAAAFPSGDAMVGALQRLKRSTVYGADGFWRLHMVAFPSPAPAGGTYRLRATDTTDAQAAQAHQGLRDQRAAGAGRSSRCPTWC